MKHKLSISMLLMLAGIAFLIWGAVIYNHHPEIEELRRIMWSATKFAAPQNVIGLLLLLVSYAMIRDKK